MASLFHVDVEKVIHLDEEGLNALMTKLLPASAHRAGADVSLVRVNARTKAKDRGCDASTPKPLNTTTWLKDAKVCWQFKSGTASEPNKLRGEVRKELVSANLKSNGWLIVVASGCSGGDAGALDREQVLKDEAASLSLPTDRICVYSADQLARWASEHPAAAALLYDGLPQVSIMGHDDWGGLPDHLVLFTAAGGIEDELRRLNDTFLDRPFGPTEPKMAYLAGLPGTGKTRFVIEAMLRSRAKYDIAYLPGATPELVARIADYLHGNPGAALTVVADDLLVGETEMRAIDAMVSRLEGRLRLLIIAHTTDIKIDPDVMRFERTTEDKQIESIVRGWFPGMPIEHVSYIVSRSEKNVRLARLIGEAVSSDARRSTSDIFSSTDIRDLMDRLLGDAEKESLAVAAVGDSVGWLGPAEQEGRQIAERFGLSWGKVQAAVQKAHERRGIVPSAGNRRFVTPGPLGLFLAKFAWDTYSGPLGELIRTLPEPGRTRLLERLKELGKNPATSRFATDQLRAFGALADFRADGAVHLFRAAASIEPSVAVRRLREVLEASSHADVLALGGEPRRVLVHALEELLSHRATFGDAALSLAILAAAENETYGNNATGCFLQCFHLFLSGTAAPYTERVPVLRQLWGEGRPGVRGLVLLALSRISQDHFTRIDTGVSKEQLIEPEWRPHTGQEHQDAVEAVLDLASELLQMDGGDAPVDAYSKLAMAMVPLFRLRPIASRAEAVFELISTRVPATKEELRVSLDRYIDVRERANARRGEDDVSSDWSPALERVSEKLRDRSFWGRIRETVARPRWEQREDHKDAMAALAREIAERPQVLSEPEAEWLVSGAAADGWTLGSVVGESDEKSSMADALWQLTRSRVDTRLLGGYLVARREANGQPWLDDWLDARSAMGPDQIFDLTLRIGVGGRALARIESMLRERSVNDRAVGGLEYGTLMQDASAGGFAAIMGLLVENEAWRTTALSIAAHQVSRFVDPSTGPALDGIATSLLQDKRLLYGRGSVSRDYEWATFAKPFVPRIPVALMRVLFDAHLGRDDGGHRWFLEHSHTLEILQEAMRIAPGEAWALIAECLEDPGYIFTIGLPHSLLDLVPAEDVLAWVRGGPERRAALLTHVVRLEFDNDDSLAMRLLESFGGTKRVRDAFWTSIWSGSWTGEASDRYDRLAADLERAVSTTKLPVAKRWLSEWATELRQAAGREREKEAEERLLWR